MAMSQIGFGALACSLLGWLCAPAPGVAIIQSAYEREASAASIRHDSGLRVREAKCHDRDEGRYLCEVTFTSADDPTERLYFDIVAVDRSSTGWTLTSGLCKR
jgi:hypothetical protein